MPYVGRFAPSPTGPLHIGSLTAALASYLHARQAHGQWLVRIEDIDPPREVPGAADRILATLEAFDLEWDQTVHYQSGRLACYAAVAQSLLRDGQAFHCSCTRSELRKTSGVGELGAWYPGFCRTRPTHDRATAIRLRVDQCEVNFVDGLQGPQSHNLSTLTGDYVIMRKNALPAYHLATVLDDLEFGVTHVVRGIDLLLPTAVHIHLQRALGGTTPKYLHVPILVNGAGQKLSKQTGATAVNDGAAPSIAVTLLAYLGVRAPRELFGARPKELWNWAVEAWEPASLAGQAQLSEDQIMD